METMSMQYFPVTPQTELSHVRHSVPRTAANPDIAREATRTLHAPAGSFSSLQTTPTSELPPLQSISSNVSQATNSTDITSATSSGQASNDKWTTNESSAVAVDESKPGMLVDENRSLASPMSIDLASVTNGSKRTASGHVKNALSLNGTPTTATFVRGHSRGDSISSTGSRAGEMAHSLKARLSYAMAKVQNGWEHRTLTEVEELTAHKIPSNRYSMSQVEYTSRPVSSGLNSGAARLSMHDTPRSGYDDPVSPPSKRHSGAYASFMMSPPQSQSTLGSPPALQPPVDIQPVSKRQSYTAPSGQTTKHVGAMSPPRTPMNARSRRPATIRTDLQTAEAERDALQALFQLGSPHASQMSHQITSASQASSVQGSPLKAEFATPRRVTFATSESASDHSPSDHSPSTEISSYANHK